MRDTLIYFEPVADNTHISIDNPEQYVQDQIRYSDEVILEQLNRREWAEFEDIETSNYSDFKQKLVNYFKPYFDVAEVQDGVLELQMNRYKYLRFAAHMLDLDEEILLMRKLALKQSANSLSTDSWLYDKKITDLLDMSKIKEYEELHNPFQAILVNIEDSQTYTLLELVQSQVEAGVSKFHVFTGIYARLYD